MTSQCVVSGKCVDIHYRFPLSVLYFNFFFVEADMKRHIQRETAGIFFSIET